MDSLRKNKSFFFFLLLASCLTACGKKEIFYEKSVVFPAEASLEEKMKMAERVVPSQKQLDWQKLELTAFIHFGINTFTGKEWGNGKEDPAIFNPTDLDTEQWVKNLYDAGMRMVILTAKHHDGFCLWPTKTTKHSVASSPWKNGKGDVVKELKEACEKYDMKFGIYLSPWDQNASIYGTDAYNDFFIAQLTELLSNYGKVDEVWFDGANGEGPNGKKQVYDWEAYYATIKKLQPQAVTAVMGEDVRWVGTETGYGRETEWSVTPLAPCGAEENQQIKQALKLSATSEDLGSSELIAKASQLFWFPAEVDVSIRPGWFYHPEQDEQVKSLAKMVDIYFNSVGRNAVLLLNIPPDKRGLVHENDIAVLKELRNYLDQMYAVNLAASEEGKYASLFDQEYDSYYSLKGPKGEIVLDFGVEKTFNVLELQEYIPRGQKIESFTLMAWLDNEWKQVIQSTTVGYKKLKRFEKVTTDKVKLSIDQSRGDVFLNKLALYEAPDVLTDPRISRNKEGWVSIETEMMGPEIYYTLDGTEPTPESTPYKAPFELKEEGVVKAKAFVEDGKRSSEIISKEFDIAPFNWQVMDFSAEHENFPAALAIDGLVETMWHTPWKGEAAITHPHHISVDMGEEHVLTGFHYSPRAGESKSGTVLSYKFWVSSDGKNWKQVLKGNFSNMKNNPIAKKVYFKAPLPARYFRFESSRGIYEDEAWTSAGEIGVLTK
jgi:alpha-L-fucosidase